MEFKRLFTVDEARTVLTRIRPALIRLRAAAAELQLLAQDHDKAGAVAAGDGHFDARALGDTDEERIERLRRRVSSTVAQLRELGIEIKDPVRGLIDFPHDRDGETVFLCYHLDEETIRYWHRIADGYAGRQPLDGS